MIGFIACLVATALCIQAARSVQTSMKAPHMRPLLGRVVPGITILGLYLAAGAILLVAVLPELP